MNDPVLYKLFDKLYNTAASIMPEFLQERPMFTAFGCGFAGSYGLTRLAQKGIRTVAPEFYYSNLPKIEKGLAKIVMAAPVAYMLIDPNAKELVMEHPVYSSGVIGGLAGGVTAAFQDAYKDDPMRDSNKFFKELDAIMKQKAEKK